MSVEVVSQPLARIGNELFYYITARLFAEENDLKLTSLFSPKNGQDLVQMAPTKNGEMVSSPMIRLTDDPGFPGVKPGPYRVLGNQDELFGISWPKARYVFDGWFQRAYWFHERRKEIESFARLDPVREVNTRDIVINLRIGDDYKNLGWVIHPKWYLDILAQESFDRLHIVADHADPAYLAHFSKYDPVVQCSWPKADWEALRSFDRVIMSNSTFCWWAVFFGQASRVFVFKRWVPHSSPQLAYFPQGIHLDGAFLHEQA